MQLEKMPLNELLRLKQRVDQLVAKAQEKERQALKEKFARMAHDAGFTLEELVGQGENSLKPMLLADEEPPETSAQRQSLPQGLPPELTDEDRLKRGLIG